MHGYTTTWQRITETTAGHDHTYQLYFPDPNSPTHNQIIINTPSIFINYNLGLRSICYTIHTESLIVGSALCSNKTAHIWSAPEPALAAARCNGVLPACKINITSKCDLLEHFLFKCISIQGCSLKRPSFHFFK